MQVGVGVGRPWIDLLTALQHASCVLAGVARTALGWGLAASLYILHLFIVLQAPDRHTLFQITSFFVPRTFVPRTFVQLHCNMLHVSLQRVARTAPDWGLAVGLSTSL